MLLINNKPDFYKKNHDYFEKEIDAEISSKMMLINDIDNGFLKELTIYKYLINTLIYNNKLLRTTKEYYIIEKALDEMIDSKGDTLAYLDKHMFRIEFNPDGTRKNIFDVLAEIQVPLLVFEQYSDLVSRLYLDPTMNDVERRKLKDQVACNNLIVNGIKEQQYQIIYKAIMNCDDIIFDNLDDEQISIINNALEAELIILSNNLSSCKQEDREIHENKEEQILKKLNLIDKKNKGR